MVTTVAEGGARALKAEGQRPYLCLLWGGLVRSVCGPHLGPVVQELCLLTQYTLRIRKTILLTRHAVPVVVYKMSGPCLVEAWS